MTVRLPMTGAVRHDLKRASIADFLSLRRAPRIVALPIHRCPDSVCASIRRASTRKPLPAWQATHDARILAREGISPAQSQASSPTSSIASQLCPFRRLVSGVSGFGARSMRRTRLVLDRLLHDRIGPGKMNPPLLARSLTPRKTVSWSFLG